MRRAPFISVEYRQGQARAGDPPAESGADQLWTGAEALTGTDRGCAPAFRRWVNRGSRSEPTSLHENFVHFRLTAGFSRVERPSRFCAGNCSARSDTTKKNKAGAPCIPTPEQKRVTLVSDSLSQTGQKPAPVSVQPFQFRGLFLTAIALRLETDAPDGAFYAALDAQLAKTPHLLAGAPMVLDFAQVPEFSKPADVRDMIDNLFARDLQIFGAQNATDAQLSAVKGYGIIPIKVGRETAMPEPKPQKPQPAAKRTAPPVARNKIVRSPVRSGQMIVAEHGDLTVVGSVASGAELVAAGNIHVYGALRGRAMAGAHGDESARIFCRQLDAELLAIAGLYKTSETIPAELRHKSVQVYLDDDKLCVEAFE
ncbi:hypothetical protein B6V76_13625 [Thioclava sp. IC9]|nr:hypothetical protein B6V76_13625 [Thioclava sp. IC9]